jgi:PhzF family phenazine biosynthesis protein
MKSLLSCIVMTSSLRVLRYAAFSTSPSGGNPAGVVMDADGLDEATMQRIAADVGYSETAFLTARGLKPDGAIRVRYFSPETEVAFCGHATIAAGVALGEAQGPGRFPLITNVGPVLLTVNRADTGAQAATGDGAITATFESPPAGAEPLPEAHQDRLLATLGWSRADLNPRFPAMIGTAGNRHPVLVASHLDRLAHLDYDFPALTHLCREHDWTTIQLVVSLGDGRWRSRNPFPLGGVIEDPATGAAAAALAGYLRTLGAARAGDRLIIEQGVEMGRPSTIDTLIAATTALVTGTATRIPTSPA